MSHSYDAVLFDFDGVIVDSEPVHYACWRKVLLDCGYDLDWVTYRDHFIGISDRKMVEAIVKLSTVPLSADDIIRRYPEKRDLFRSEMQREVPLTPGVRELFYDLRQVPVGVVTSSLRLEVEPVLERCGLLSQLSVVIYGDDVQRHKPDPEPYATAAQRISVSRALVVEDSAAGEASGRAAGFDVVRVPEASQMVTLVRRHLGIS